MHERERQSDFNGDQCKADASQVKQSPSRKRAPSSTIPAFSQNS